MQHLEPNRRGFSLTFTQAKAQVRDMQFIEGGELERAWKASRREKLKQQETKIWEDFIKEQDMVQSIYNTDPYQFVEQLPASNVTEVLKIQKFDGKETEQQKKEETPRPEGVGDGDGTDKDRMELEITDSDIFHIFADNTSEQDANSVNEMESPCTVRENMEEVEKEDAKKSVAKKESSDKMSLMIEDSIYCAKVKDLRLKITDEIMSLIIAIEALDPSKLQPNDIQSAKRRAIEFTTRFNRVHMYQLQRQMQDIKRNMNVLPFAKHTHFHSQMTRVTSLHNNYYHAVQMLVKAVVGMCGSEEWCEAGRGAAGAGGDLSLLCTQVTHPHTDTAHLQLYNDDMIACCNKLNATIDEYLNKVSAALNPVPKMTKRSNKKHRNAGKKPPAKSCSETDTRFSMYSSQCTLKSTNTSKMAPRENQSGGTSKVSCAVNSISNSNRGMEPPATHKSPGRIRRRPLMRGNPSEDVPRRKVVSREADIQTLVQDVTTCTPTQSINGDNEHLLDEIKSPRMSLERQTTPRFNRLPPLRVSPVRSPQTIPKKKINPPPSPPHVDKSPKKRTTFTTPRTKIEVKTVEKIEEIPIELEEPGITPVCRVQLLKNTEVNTRVVSPTPTETKTETPRTKKLQKPPEVYDVTQLLKKLCGGDNMTSSRNEKVQGKSKNTMLLNVNGSSPRQQQPSTPELLKILEETIQKKLPKPPSSPDPKKYRLQFNLPEKTGQTLFSYRSKYIQHMLSSPMYANSVMDKPWEVIARLSEQILNDLIKKVAKEIQIKDALKELYRTETKT